MQALNIPAYAETCSKTWARRSTVQLWIHWTLCSEWKSLSRIRKRRWSQPIIDTYFPGNIYICVCVRVLVCVCIYIYICLHAVLSLITQSFLTLWDPLDCSLPGSSVHGDSPGKNTGVGYHALLQGLFPSQGSNPCLPHCRWILYLSHKRSAWILEWVAYHFSRGSTLPRNWTRVSCNADRFFSSWATRALPYIYIHGICVLFMCGFCSLSIHMNPPI